MVAQKITETFLNRISRRKARAGLYYDTEMTGFGVRISGKGKISFIAEAKIRGTQRSRRIKIGNYPVYSVDQAKGDAANILRLCYAGIDPKIYREQEQAKREKAYAQRIALSSTFSEILEEFFKRKDLKPKTAYDYRQTIELYCDDWMNKPIRDITEQDATDKFYATRDKAGRHEGQSGEAQAVKLKRYLSSVFSYARTKKINGERLISINPFIDIFKELGVKRNVKPRNRILHPSELQKLFDELDRQDWLDDWARANVSSDSGYIAMRHLIKKVHNKGFAVRTVREYLRLLLFTGLRRDEALKLKWTDVNFEDRFFIVKEPKNDKDHYIPITDTIRKLFERQKANIPEGCIWVFPSPRNSKIRLTEPRYQLGVLCEELGFKFTFHDLRRTFASYGNEYGLDLYSIGRALNHTFSGPTPLYIVETVETIRHIFEKIEEQIRYRALNEPVVSKMTWQEQKVLQESDVELYRVVEQTKDEQPFKVEEGAFDIKKYEDAKKA